MGKRTSRHVKRRKAVRHKKRPKKTAVEPEETEIITYNVHRNPSLKAVFTFLFRSVAIILALFMKAVFTINTIVRLVLVVVSVIVVLIYYDIIKI